MLPALAALINPPTPALDKFSQVARDIREADAEEQAEWERRREYDAEVHAEERARAAGRARRNGE